MEYTYHTDPGHGWIEVPLSELRRLKLKPSPYSYKKGQLAYLEEDCDASAWTAAKRAAGEPFQLVTQHTDHDHPIRNFSSFGA